MRFCEKIYLNDARTGGQRERERNYIFFLAKNIYDMENSVTGVERRRAEISCPDWTQVGLNYMGSHKKISS